MGPQPGSAEGRRGPTALCLISPGSLYKRYDVILGLGSLSILFLILPALILISGFGDRECSGGKGIGHIIVGSKCPKYRIVRRLPIFSISISRRLISVVSFSLHPAVG